MKLSEVKIALEKLDKIAFKIEEDLDTFFNNLGDILHVF